MKRTGLILIAIPLMVSTMHSQFVNIPDRAFLYALFEEGVDTNNVSLISYDEAEAINSLDFYYRIISDMTGIEASAIIGVRLKSTASL